MTNLIDKFQCQEYLGEKYKSGLFHPFEQWSIYSNQNCRVSRDGKLLIIGGIFDDHDLEFCYQTSRNGIWALERDGEIAFYADRLHEMVEGWYPQSDSTWSEMDTVARWKSAELYLQHHSIHYQWNMQPLIGYIQRCAEIGLNRSTSLLASENHISISQEITNSPKSEIIKSASIVKDPHSNNYRVLLEENQYVVSGPKFYNAIELDQSIDQVVEWLTH